MKSCNSLISESLEYFCERVVLQAFAILPLSTVVVANVLIVFASSSVEKTSLDLYTDLLRLFCAESSGGLSGS